MSSPGDCAGTETGHTIENCWALKGGGSRTPRVWRPLYEGDKKKKRRAGGVSSSLKNRGCVKRVYSGGDRKKNQPNEEMEK